MKTFTIKEYVEMLSPEGKVLFCQSAGIPSKSALSQIISGHRGVSKKRAMRIHDITHGLVPVSVALGIDEKYLAK